MTDVSSGRVYLALNDGWVDADSDDEPNPFWYGHCEFDELEVERGPEFTDASDAVKWWRDGGAKWITISMGDESVLWAGEGAAPVDRRGVPLDFFAHDDPRGRIESALIESKVRRLRTRESLARQRMKNSVRSGQDLRRPEDPN